MARRDYEPGEIKALGESIYKEQVQARIGPVEDGTVVVIDVESADYEIDASDAAATRRLLNRRPHAVTYGVRVGYRAAYRHPGGIGCLNPVAMEQQAGNQTGYSVCCAYR